MVCLRRHFQARRGPVTYLCFRLGSFPTRCKRGKTTAPSIVCWRRRSKALCNVGWDFRIVKPPQKFPLFPLAVPTDRLATVACVFAADVAGAESARIVRFREKPEATFTDAIDLICSTNRGLILWVEIVGFWERCNIRPHCAPSI